MVLDPSREQRLPPPTSDGAPHPRPAGMAVVLVCREERSPTDMILLVMKRGGKVEEVLGDRLLRAVFANSLLYIRGVDRSQVTTTVQLTTSRTGAQRNAGGYFLLNAEAWARAAAASWHPHCRKPGYRMMMLLSAFTAETIAGPGKPAAHAAGAISASEMTLKTRARR